MTYTQKIMSEWVEGANKKQMKAYWEELIGELLQTFFGLRTKEECDNLRRVPR